MPILKYDLNYNIHTNMQIKSAEFVVSNTDVGRCPKDGLPEFAFIGRSNVGKSSLINMLTARKGLAMTSSTPGKTTLINHFLVNGNWYLVDLPGYGYAKRSKKDVDKLTKIISDYVIGRHQMTNLFVLVDSRLKPQKIDLEFIEWLGENGVPFSIVYTKSDKVGSSVFNNNLQALKAALSEQWEELPRIFVTSSEKKAGRDELLDYIEEIMHSLKDGGN